MEEIISENMSKFYTGDVDHRISIDSVAQVRMALECSAFNQSINVVRHWRLDDYDCATPLKILPAVSLEGWTSGPPPRQPECLLWSPSNGVGHLPSETEASLGCIVTRLAVR